MFPLLLVKRGRPAAAAFVKRMSCLTMKERGAPWNVLVERFLEESSGFFSEESPKSTCQYYFDIQDQNANATL